MPNDAFIRSKEKDMVNSPAHYNKHGVECIQAIRATLTDQEFRGYCKGNVLKYTWREGYKNKDEDLQKAQWYLNRLLSELSRPDSKRIRNPYES